MPPRPRADLWDVPMFAALCPPSPAVRARDHVSEAHPIILTDIVQQLQHIWVSRSLLIRTIHTIAHTRVHGIKAFLDAMFKLCVPTLTTQDAWLYATRLMQWWHAVEVIRHYFLFWPLP